MSRSSVHNSSRLVFDLRLAGRLNAKASVGTGITAIFGQSGAGKTSLLRSLVGLQAGLQGSVTFDGSHWQSAGKRLLAVEKRRIGYVSQTPALFQHMTVAENLQFAVKRAIIPFSGSAELLGLLVKESWQHKPVKMLSGGESQRVAIAQALLANPQLLLLDEPFSGLDATTKAALMPGLRDLLLQLDIPTIIVTHSALEVATLADRVLLMRDGAVSRQAAVADVLPAMVNQAESATDAGQLFSMLEATVVAVDLPDQLIELACGEATLWMPLSGRPQASATDNLRLIVHSRDISVSTKEITSSSILNRLKVSIKSIDDTAQEGVVRLGLVFGDNALTAMITKRSFRQLKLQVGQSVWAQVKSMSLG